MKRLPDSVPHVPPGRDAYTVVSAFIGRTQRRMHIVSILYGIAAGAASAAAAMVAGRAAGASELPIEGVALLLGTMLAVAVAVVGTRQGTRARAALLVEKRGSSLDNLVITAEELPRRSPPVHPLIAGEIVRQAAARLALLRAETIVPLVRPVVLAATFGLCLILVATTGREPADRPRANSGSRIQHGFAEPGGIESVVVRVAPPPYSGLPQHTMTDPVAVHVLEGSRVDVEVMADAAGVDLVRPDGRVTRMDGEGRQHRAALVAAETQFLVLRPLESASSRSRLLSIIVDPDRRPSVHVRAPARDLAFTRPEGRIPLEVEASDDVGLDALQIRYTRISGSGEAFTFNEGTLPLAIARTSRGHWTATSEMSLSVLGLEEGDTLVYRAVARDGKPGADPASSDSYIVEIGETPGVASSGFALPDDKDRHAISQQMVIMKTERLNAERAGLDENEVQEQSRLLAVEQRMVRAEFVFMTGGEVQDEVEEAEHSHDLVEGRFENEGQVELLAALREMSRAEAALNAVETRAALTFERAALAALQRAFDRRRYLLRTLPERARIDPSRRLSGARAAARSWNRAAPTAAVSDAVGQMSDLMRALETSLRSGRDADLPALAARLGALAPADASVQEAAAALGRGESRTTEERAEGIRAAMRIVSARATRLLALPMGATLPAESLIGHVADEHEARERR